MNPWVPNDKMISLTSNASRIEKVAYTPHILEKVTLELGVTSLKSNTIEPCKGKSTS